jgi:putative pyruvate formate lyase activating enzyme
LAETFSDCRNYPEIARNAFKEIYRQKGSTVVLNDNGQAVMGMIIRHLVLPGQVEDSINILKWIAGELSPSVYISLMSQYYPTVCVANHPMLGKKVSVSEYQQVLEVMEELGFHKGWIQQYESTDYYLPDFTHDHPFETP